MAAIAVPAIALASALAAMAGAAWLFERRRRRRAETARCAAETARSRLEKEARDQAFRTAALFDRMLEGVVVTDAHDRIGLANRAAGAILGFTLPATGSTLLEATRRHEIAAVLARLDREPEVIGHEFVLESPAGPRHLQVNAVALTDSAGPRDGALLVFHDLTGLRRLEAARQEFVANVSHELRTPLSLVKSAVETLLDGAKDDPAALLRFLRIVERHTNRLAALIEDLLLLGSLDSGQLRLQRQPVRVRDAVEEVFGDLASRARERNTTLGNFVPGSLVVDADPDRLRQVLVNLLDNAVKYGRPAGRVRATAAALGDAMIEVAIADDGPGLPPEAQARVFERFFRVDKARSREQGGTGLGLAIVKHVVQAHGGEVRVESTPGAGATFFFSLPAPHLPAAPAASAPAP
jgi:two-component system phosphate regulon sensor histidine kinase PhoR